MSQGGDKPEDGANNEGPRWAADEPTAMWDEQSLRDKGYEDAASAPRTATGPATAPSVGGDDAAKVHAPAMARGPSTRGNQPARRPPPGLSWPVTVGVAVIVAIVVYFAVRTLIH